jgi:glycine cleavage system H protein
MSDDLHFMMGQYKAVIPVDRVYSPRHLWLKTADDGIIRVGFTAYSVRLLQDVYFLEWSIDEQTAVLEKQEIGEIESSKALSSLFPPFAGTIHRFNPEILNDPSAINVDPYGEGWLYEFTSDQSPVTAAHYVEVLEQGWQNTQRTIKGQLND